MNAFALSPTGTNSLIDVGAVHPEVHERMAVQEFIDSISVEFPLSEEMSAAARNIQNRVYNNIDYIRTNPDRKL